MFSMQGTFDFGAAGDLLWVRDQLRSCFGRVRSIPLRTPVGQLVKSSISGRTRDEVSTLAYRRLVETYPGWADVANAAIAEVEAVIGDVTFPDVKARYLHDALQAIAARQPDFDLAFLHRLGVGQALAWLERLPGVGRKVSRPRSTSAPCTCPPSSWTRISCGYCAVSASCAARPTRGTPMRR